MAFLGHIVALNQIGILDVGEVCEGQTALSALDSSQVQAVLADEFGFSRYWLGEHHETSRAWATPLLVLPLLGRMTKRIRVGTAGVLLPLHQPIAVAEAFAFLETIFPGRVDCGLAGGVPETAIAAEYGLATGDRAEFETEFQIRFSRLVQLFTRAFPAGHRLSNGVAPVGTIVPEIWMMGVSGKKREIASKVGASFSYSLMHKRSTHNPSEMQAYYQDFRPGLSRVPNGNIAVRVACAENTEEAKKIKFPDGLPHPQVSGNPHECLEQLHSLAITYGVTEVIIRIQGRTGEEKIRACSLLGRAFSERVLLRENAASPANNTNVR